MDDKKTKISKDESVKIPYGLFEKMLNNQKEISKMFCRTIIIIFTILVLFMLVLSIGYFVLWWWIMDAQEYINETVNERLDKLETKVDSLENKITNIEISNAKQMIILEKIEKNVEENKSVMSKAQNKVFWGIIAAIGSLVLAFIQQLILN